MCTLTAIMLDIIHSNVSGNEGGPVVFLLIPLLSEQLCFGIFCADDVLYLCTCKNGKKRVLKLASKSRWV